MAGYIYCMKNGHSRYGKYLKVGYTERTPGERAVELSRKWGCKFEVLWDLDVYEPAKAELFVHEYLNKVRVEYEFFNVDPDVLKQWAEKFFDERWREIEGKEVLPPTLVDLADRDGSGFLLNPEQGEDDHKPD